MQTPCPARWPPRTGTQTRIAKRPAPDRLRHVSSILRLELGSWMRFYSADASLTDHSFATVILIEVNFRLCCAAGIFSNRMGQLAGKPALPWYAPAKQRACSHALS